MSDLETKLGTVSQERTLLRWAGIAGVLGGLVFILVPVVQFGFVPPAPSDPAAVVARFPSISAALTVGNNINLASDILILVLLLGLYRALRRTSLAPAVIGTVLSILGLAVLKATGFGKRLGGLSVALGALSLIGIALIPVLGEASIVAVLALPVYVVLPILWGRRLSTLSKTSW